MDRLILLRDTPLCLTRWNDTKKQSLFSELPSPENISLKNEITILRAIRAHAATHHAQDRFFHLLDWDESRTIPQWFTTTTFALGFGCPLEALQCVYPRLPEEFAWLVFVQLLEALEFLHRVCQPAVVHGDLVAGNIMIGYEGEFDDYGGLHSLPKIKLIDFEGAAYCSRREGEAAERYDASLAHTASQPFTADVLGCIDILYGILARHPSIADPVAPKLQDARAFPDVQADDAKLHLLFQTLEASWTRGCGNKPWVLQSLYGYFAPYAYTKLAEIEEAAERAMWDGICDGAGEKFREVKRWFAA
ncbi:hypothetical protein LEMA_P078690.1 [Plenodomus lingam JN3]|uniref:Protein kinase domain-containing protein n=1 Tax=Leptosphaeria maculans (strain JN3 / isolate v23.1.3 / race Av1-4-5-6-7-8) TaxID=985895 RepID=E5A4T2_LEPMJ|nr:hypothetical protein LEMA_P078690.1 [Plenodomus lingam JN3]CBX98630.1 hypothetical protein LEMA_P078690.1 [Plenodomus lingam JN3]